MGEKKFELQKHFYVNFNNERRHEKLIWHFIEFLSENLIRANFEIRRHNCHQCHISNMIYMILQKLKYSE